MDQPAYFGFNCLNPECGQKIKLSIPKKSGIYKVTCPHCGAQKQLRIKGLDELNAQQPESAQLAKDLGDDFYTDRTYNVECPHCKAEEIELKQDKAGTGTAECPHCKGKVTFTFRPPTLVNDSELVQPSKGKLVMLRKGWLNKSFPLQNGINTIGRFDEKLNSDVAIKGDPAMSRRSIEIDVEKKEKGFAFKLTVKNATNPVLHNNKPLRVGEAVSLNFGDSIILGKTKFRLEKED